VPIGVHLHRHLPRPAIQHEIERPWVQGAFQNPLETQVATATLRVRFQPQADLKVGLYEVRKLSPG
jgi:hypothetical protein